MRHPLFSLTAATLLTSGLLTPIYAAPPQTEMFDEKRVQKIEIVFENVPEGEVMDPKQVLSRLETRSGDLFSQRIFDIDLKILAAEYDRVIPALHSREDGVEIILKIWVKPMIDSISFSGNVKVKTSTLKRELGIESKSLFDRQSFNKAFNKLREYYVKKGFFEAELSYKISGTSRPGAIALEIDIEEGRSGLINTISFQGFSKKEESDILEKIYTKKFNLFTSWLTGSGKFNEEMMAQDTLTIVNFLQNEGYADAKVAINISDVKAGKRIAVEIVADRGEKYHYRRINFKGNTLFSNENLEKIFAIHPGDDYSPEKMRQTVQNIKDSYGRKGYIEANIQFEALPVEDENAYDIFYTIEEGLPYRIGLIHVIGNIQTASDVILRETFLIPGEIFDTMRLKATQTRLENMGYFKNVNVYSVRSEEPIDGDELYRDVYIEVEESTTGNLGLSVGFSTAEDLYGGVDLTEKNFNIKGLSSLFSDGPVALRGGGEYAQLGVKIGQKQTSYSVSWLDPYFRDTRWQFGFDLSVTSSEIVTNDYSIKTYGGSLNAAYPLTQFWTFRSKYRARYIDVDATEEFFEKGKKHAEQSGNISAASVGIGFDSTDNSFRPHRGFRSLFDIEYAGLLGDFCFGKLVWTNNLYTPLWRGGTMKYRFETKFLQPLGKTDTFEQISVGERFFMGGETTVRGYAPFTIGPVGADGEPIGGISSGLISLEFSQELHKLIDAFVFADAGVLTRETFKWDTFRLSYGVGLRMYIPGQPPITLGYGWPVNPLDESQIRRFFFAFGALF